MRDKVRLETEPPSGKLQLIYKTDSKTAEEDDAIEAVFMHSVQCEAMFLGTHIGYLLPYLSMKNKKQQNRCMYWLLKVLLLLEEAVS